MYRERFHALYYAPSFLKWEQKVGRRFNRAHAKPFGGEGKVRVFMRQFLLKFA
jgi:hypothetical protein